MADIGDEHANRYKYTNRREKAGKCRRCGDKIEIGELYCWVYDADAYWSGDTMCIVCANIIYECERGIDYGEYTSDRPSRGNSSGS